MVQAQGVVFALEHREKTYIYIRPSLVYSSCLFLSCPLLHLLIDGVFLFTIALFPFHKDPYLCSTWRFMNGFNGIDQLSSEEMYTVITRQ
jgi:hypothetical protein